MELFYFLTKFYTALLQDARISATHLSVYMALIQEWNSTGGKNPFPINREEIMRAAKINARFTYNKCLNNLQEFGYIEYLPSTNTFTHSIIYIKSIE